MLGSGTNLNRFERENAGLRKMQISGTAANPAAEPAVGGDERVEIKEILKMMSSGTAKFANFF